MCQPGWSKLHMTNVLKRPELNESTPHKGAASCLCVQRQGEVIGHQEQAQRIDEGLSDFQLESSGEQDQVI